MSEQYMGEGERNIFYAAGVGMIVIGIAFLLDLPVFARMSAGLGGIFEAIAASFGYAPFPGEFFNDALIFGGGVLSLANGYVGKIQHDEKEDPSGYSDAWERENL